MSLHAGKPPLVSIIIPVLVFDAALRETLVSLGRSGGEFPEVLVQHGGSGPVEMEEGIVPFPVLAESRPDGGVYQAINRAVERATGRYVLVLGAGDTLRPGILDGLRPLLETEPRFDAVYGDVWMKDQGIRYLGEFKPGDFFRHNICQQGLFYLRETLIAMGGFKVRYPVLSDYEFNVRLFSRPGARVHHEPVVVCDYLGGGLSSRAWRDDPWIAEREKAVAAAFGINKPKRDSRSGAALRGESPPFSE